MGDDVPSTFEQLIVGNPQAKQPRDAGCVAARTFQQVAVSLAVPIPPMQCVLSQTIPHYFQASVTQVPVSWPNLLV